VRPLFTASFRESRETSYGISFVYYPAAAEGIWYQYTCELPDVGLLGPTRPLFSDLLIPWKRSLKDTIRPDRTKVPLRSE